MSKLPIYIAFFIIDIYFSQIKEIYCQNKKRSLDPKSADLTAKGEDEDENRESRLLQTLYSDSFSYNYYYATLYIGPKQVKQSFIIDTGTAMMSSLCVPCDYCGNNKTYYFENIERKVRDPLKCGSKICRMIPASGCNFRSKSKDKKTCSFYNQKPNGDALRGYYLKNIVYFEEAQNTTFPSQKKVYRSYALPMGCTLGEYGFYKEIKADGVMGMNNEETSFISLLYNLKVIKKNIFSLCFGLKGGYMSLGDIDKTYHSQEKIDYVPLLNNTVYYSININFIKIGEEKTISTPQMPAYIDTGSTLTILPRNYYKFLINEFTNLCTDKKEKINRCGKFYHDKKMRYCSEFEDWESLFKTVNEYWPNITLKLDNNTNYIWRPINYYYYYINGTKRKACLGFKFHRYNHTILGVNFMHENDIIFDKEQKLLGIVPADCSRKNIMWNKMEGVLQNPPEVKDPALAEKEIHKNENDDNFNYGDNGNKEEVRFIKGKNRELDSIDFNLVNFLILLISILVIVVLLFVAIISLLLNKKGYIKYLNLSEETNKLNTSQNNNVIEEINDNKVIQDELQHLKQMRKD